MQNVQHSMQNQILDIDSVFFYLKKKKKQLTAFFNE